MKEVYVVIEYSVSDRDRQSIFEVYKNKTDAEVLAKYRNGIEQNWKYYVETWKVR